MKLLLLGATGAVVLFLFVTRREKPWPREGHGRTYFGGTSRQ
jgi:hypothetical protein